nr:NAD-dependent succinate-semialdehyde dehydrogenase [Corynebacterium lactis]
MTTNGYRVQNPVDNAVLETFEQASDADIQNTLAAADTAWADWAAKPIEERAKIVTRVAELFEERKDELAAIAAQEMGKPIPEGIEEVEFSSVIIQYYADNGAKFIEEQEIPTDANGVAKLRRLPIGALLGIMPWNFPYYQVARFAGPNLMLGNTIVLKHAETCPKAALAIQKIMDDAGVPEGVYTNVFASHDQVADIIADPRIQGVSLTGSERAGSAVGELAGRHLKKAVLELGGSDPYIILDTDDVKEAAQTAWATRMYNTGQACNSNKRMIVMADIYDEFVAELVSLAEAMEPAAPQDAGGAKYSPLSSRGAAENLDRQVREAVNQGATLRAGGVLAAEGAYFSPAVLTDVKRGSSIYYEELFGPVAVVYKAESDEEALEIANDSRYGLGGAVFSRDEARAKKLAAFLQVGMSNVNTPAGEGAELPFGGVKRSGFGRELGPLGMDEFVNKQLYFVENQ